MVAPESNIADVLPEPADGTHLVRIEYDNTHTVIWRDDAARISEHEDERWLTDNQSDPMCWPAILKYATAVHAISEKPLATLPPAKADT